MEEIYLDNNASTRVAPEVIEAMLPFFSGHYANPSSLHKMGVEAQRAIRVARYGISELLGVEPEELVFTSGGTEGNNMIIKGVARAQKRLGNHIVVSAVEHKAVLNTCKQLEAEGFETTYVKPDETGNISPEIFAGAITDKTILVGLMHVNNEIGTIYDIGALARHIKSAYPKIIFFSDGVQAFSKLPINLGGVDAYVISGHKFHGPKGVGALYIKAKTRLVPLIAGGGHEMGLRSGTENVPGIVGLAAAAKLAYKNMTTSQAHLKTLANLFREGLRQIEDAHINSRPEAIHTTVHASFPGVPSEILLHSLEEFGIFASPGSACANNKSGASHVLSAIGLEQEKVNSSIRFSFSRYTKEEEIHSTLRTLIKLVPRLRQATK